MIFIITSSLNKMHIKIGFRNFIIFSSGAIFAVLAVIILNQHLAGKHSKLNHLPDLNFIQVRDDFSVYNPRKSIDPNDSKNIQKKTEPANEQEAIGSLKLAQQMRHEGKEEKAFKLFQHAMALAPKHPEILIKYGEFLEHSKLDILKADQLYYQALTINPENSEALEHRKRTASIVDILDENRLKALDQKVEALSGIHESNKALRRAKKEAYFQHIYHSVGIEGNTMTLAQTRSILETRMAIEGKSIDEHNEILGLDAAMKYINDTLVNKDDYITLKDILQIHRRVLGHVDPIEGGEFRTTQVYVGGHTPPGPGHLSILMRRFEDWLNSPHAISLHPLKYAALAHYKLVHIHPFTDGNGRTSRLLMNTILMRASYPPVIIPKQQRHMYYEFLQLANEGDIRPFIRFIAECTEKTIDLYLWATSDLPQQIPMVGEQSNLIIGNTPSPENKLEYDERIIYNYHEEDDGSGLNGK